MPATLELNAELIRKRIDNIDRAAGAMGMRAATLSDLLSGRTNLQKAEVGTLVRLAEFIGCGLDDLILHAQPRRESFAESISRWKASATGTRTLKGARVENPVPESERIDLMKSLPDATMSPSAPRRRRPNPV